MGSIYALYNGRKIKSIYQDGWTNSKSGEIQEIVSDPENAHVSSENGDTLVNYYNELNDDADKELFINSLISRINREKEYYCVSYLLLYVGFQDKNSLCFEAISYPMFLVILLTGPVPLFFSGDCTFLSQTKVS